MRCGCGLAAPIATRGDTAKGYVKGEPIRFIKGYNNRLRIAHENPRWMDEEAGYAAMHKWVAKHKAKTGICADYWELCRPCHWQYDHRDSVTFALKG